MGRGGDVEREWEQERSSICGGWGWASLKPGAQSPSESPMWVSDIQASGPSSIALPDPLAESYIENETVLRNGLKPVLIQ